MRSFPELTDLRYRLEDMIEENLIIVEVINQYGTSKFFDQATVKVRDGAVHITADLRLIGETDHGRPVSTPS